MISNRHAEKHSESKVTVPSESGRKPRFSLRNRSRAAPAPVRCGARRRTRAPLFTGCASTYGGQYTVAAWSFLVLHDTVSVAFTASHTSREFIVWRERTTLDWDGSPCVGGLPRPSDRPNGQERSPTAERLGCTGAGAENRVLLLAKTVVTCGELELRRRRRSRIEPYTRTHYDPPSSESHRVSATTASPAKF